VVIFRDVHASDPYTAKSQVIRSMHDVRVWHENTLNTALRQQHCDVRLLGGTVIIRCLEWKCSSYDRWNTTKKSFELSQRFTRKTSII